MAADEEFLQGSRVIEVLFVGVDGNGDGALHAKVRDAVERVVSRAAATDDENARVGYAQRAHFFVHQGGCAAVDGVVLEPLNHVGKGRIVHRWFTH